MFFSPNTRTQNFELLASWHDCAGSIKEARNQAHFISTHESKLTLLGTRNPYVIYYGNIKPWFLRTYCRLLHQSCLQSLASIFRLGRALFLHSRYFVLVSSSIILTPSSPHKSRLPFQMSHINMVVMKSNYHCIGMLMFNAVFLYFLSKITEITEITSTN